MCHKLVVGERSPIMTVLLLYVIVAECWSKCAVHPVSHSCPMEIRECCKSGIVCAVCACSGRLGCSAKVPLWLDVTLEPSGSWTVVAVFGCKLLAGVVLVM